MVDTVGKLSTRSLDYINNGLGEVEAVCLCA